MKIKPVPIPYKYIIPVALILSLFLFLESYISYKLLADKPFDFLPFLLTPFLNYLTWVLLARLIYTNMYYNPIRKRTGVSTILRHLAVAVPIVISQVILSNMIYYAIQYLRSENLIAKSGSWIGLLELSWRTIPGDLIVRFIEYVIIVGVFTAIDISKENRRRILAMSEMEKELSEVHLRALRMQLRPHFLFNALNSISSLMNTNIKGAQTVLTRLGNIMRKMLSNTDTAFITLKDELTYVQDYLEIEQVRFHDRLEIQYDIDEFIPNHSDKSNTLNALIPCLIMQPLVENAIKHGFTKSTEHCTIIITAKREDNSLLLSVADNGMGCSDLDSVKESDGVGLRNTRSRLDRLYPGVHSIKIDSPNGKGFIVELRIPLRYK